METYEWMTVDGVELVNFARTMSYARRGVLGPGWDVATQGGNLDLPIEIEGVCAYVAGRYPFADPILDPAPWVNDMLPASADFCGLDVERIEVSGGTPARSFTPTNSGGVHGPVSRPGRTITVTGNLYARSDAGLAYGEEWITERLTAAGESCGLSTVELMPGCAEPIDGPVSGFDHAEPPAESGWFPASGATTLALTAEDPHSGPWALRLTRAAVGHGTAGVRSAFPSDPGGDRVYWLPAGAGRVTFTCWVRRDLRATVGDYTGFAYDQTVQVGLVLYDADGSIAGSVAGRVVTLPAGDYSWHRVALTGQRGSGGDATLTPVRAQVSITAGELDEGGHLDLDEMFLFPGPDPVIVAERVGLVTGLSTEPAPVGRLCRRRCSFQLGVEAPYLAHRVSQPVVTQEVVPDGAGSAGGILAVPASDGFYEALDIEVEPVSSTGNGLELYRYDPAATYVTPAGLLQAGDVHTGLQSSTWLEPVAAWTIDADVTGDPGLVRWDHATRTVEASRDGVLSAGWRGVAPDAEVGPRWFDLAAGEEHLLRWRWGGRNLLAPEDALMVDGVVRRWVAGFATTLAVDGSTYDTRRLELTATGATASVSATVDVPATPGRTYAATASVARGVSSSPRSVEVTLSYLTAGLATAGTGGATGGTEPGTFQAARLTAQAPAAPSTAAWVRLRIRVGFTTGVASGEKHHVSIVNIRTGYVAPLIGGVLVRADRRLLVP